MNKSTDPLRPGRSSIEVQLGVLFYFITGMVCLVLVAVGWIGPEDNPFLAMLFAFLGTGHGTVILSRTKLKSDAIKSIDISQQT